MGNSPQGTQLDKEQATQSVPVDKSLEWLLQTQPTVAQFLPCKPDQSPFVFKCIKCQSDQFDDGLARRICCYKCQAVLIIKDGIVELQTGLYFDERRLSPDLDGNSKTELTSLVLYCNSDNLPNELINDNVVNFKILLSKVVVPFFTIRLRFVTQGITFKIGQFEFKAVGSYPKQGIVNQKTEIYCYSSYSTEKDIEHITVVTQGQMQQPSGQIAYKMKHYFSDFPNHNNLVNDQRMKLVDDEILVINTIPQQGRITSETLVHCLDGYPTEIQELRIICQKYPQPLHEFQNSPNLEQSILKTVIIPYFTGLTRFVENGWIINNMLSFRLLYCITRVRIYLTRTRRRRNSDPFQDLNYFKNISRKKYFASSKSTKKKSFSRSAKGRKKKELYQITLVRAVGINIIASFTLQVQNFQQHYCIFSNLNQQSQDIPTEPQVIRSHSSQLQALFNGRRSLRSVRSIDHIPHQRYIRNEQHLQQIEALHHLLNTFLLLNEHTDLQGLRLKVNQGANEGMINRLPERQIDLAFLKSKGLSDEYYTRCLICLNDYGEGENVRTMPCMHYFHSECIDQWLGKNKTCPVCKTPCDYYQEGQ